MHAASRIPLRSTQRRLRKRETLPRRHEITKKTSRRRQSGGPCPRAEDPHDRRRDPAPFAFFPRQLSSSLSSQGVETGSSVVRRRAPFGGDEPSVLQPLKRRVQRPVI